MKLPLQKGVFIRHGADPTFAIRNLLVCTVLSPRSSSSSSSFASSSISSSSSSSSSREYLFCPTSDTLPWVIEPDVESQSGDTLLNAWHLVQIWRGLHYRYRLTSFPIPESPWGISLSVRGSVCFSSALPPNSPACAKLGPCVEIRVIRCWNRMPIIPLMHTILIC